MLPIHGGNSPLMSRETHPSPRWEVGWPFTMASPQVRDQGRPGPSSLSGTWPPEPAGSGLPSTRLHVRCAPPAQAAGERLWLEGSRQRDGGRAGVTECSGTLAGAQTKLQPGRVVLDHSCLPPPLHRAPALQKLCLYAAPPSLPARSCTVSPSLNLPAAGKRYGPYLQLRTVKGHVWVTCW